MRHRTLPESTEKAGGHEPTDMQNQERDVAPFTIDREMG